jgi:hypothetical protein
VLKRDVARELIFSGSSTVRKPWGSASRHRFATTHAAKPVENDRGLAVRQHVSMRHLAIRVGLRGPNSGMDRGRDASRKLFGWLPAPKLREYYVDPAVGGGQEAQRVLYLTVVTGQVRARLNGRILRLDQIALMGQINPFSLPPDLELSIEDARRKWGGP